MIRINAMYAKKVPAEIEYSSQTFSASLEVEVSDDIVKAGRTQETLSQIWSELEKSVETQIKQGEKPFSSMNYSKNNGKRNGSSHHWGNNGNGNNNGNRSNAGGTKQVSNKQASYLIDLASQRGQDFNDLCGYLNQRFGVDGVYSLTTNQAGQIINEYK